MKKREFLILFFVLGLFVENLTAPSSFTVSTTKIDSFDVNTVGIGLWSKKVSGVTDLSYWANGFYNVTHTSGSSSGYVYIYRDLSVSGKIRVEIRAKWEGTTRIYIGKCISSSTPQSDLQAYVFGVFTNLFGYHTVDGQYIYQDMGITLGEWYVVRFDIDKAKSVAKFVLYNDEGEKIYDRRVTDLLLFTKSELEVVIGSTGLGKYVYLDYVEAPFKTVDWETSGLDPEESPFDIFLDGTGDINHVEYAELTVIDFQGFKALWYVDCLKSGSQIRVHFYEDDGTYLQTIQFQWVDDAYDGVDVEVWVGSGEGFGADWTKYIGLDYDTLGKPVEIGVWREKGEWFVCMAVGHNENPLRISPVGISTSQSRIVKIIHRCPDYGHDYRSRLDEFELFAGEDEDISRPRFGGKWWEFKPIQNLRKTFVQAITVISEGITATFKPILESIKTYISSLASDTWDKFYTGWNTILSDIRSYLSSLATDAWNNFYNGWNSLFEDIHDWGTGVLSDIYNSIVSINVFNALESMSGDVVGWLGSALMNYVFTIPFSWKDAIQTMIETFLDGGEWFFGLFGLRDVFIGFENLMLSATPWISFVISIVLTFAPIVMGFHFVFAILRTVNEGDFQPLADAVNFYVNIGMFFIKIIEIVVRTIWNFIKTIAEAIPL